MDDSAKLPVLLGLAGVLFYVVIIALVPAWMVTGNFFAGFGILRSISAACGSAFVICLIVRRINRRDDPQLAERPPEE